MSHPEKVTEDVYWGDTIPTDGTWEYLGWHDEGWVQTWTRLIHVPVVARPKPVTVEVRLDLLRRAFRCACEVAAGESGTSMGRDTVNDLRALMAEAQS